ncbi:MAG: ASCH domain-containing protein [Proteobacteria bacterium]|nr:ASCH domain-containing protein [Pseudomonadota bacterium]
MIFAKKLRDRVRSGEITSSVRIWHGPRVKVGGRYPQYDGGEIEVIAIREIALSDITPAMARASGFAGVVDLLKTAKHGPGQRVFLVEFEYHSAG